MTTRMKWSTFSENEILPILLLLQRLSKVVSAATMDVEIGRPLPRLTIKIPKPKPIVLAPPPYRLIETLNTGTFGVVSLALKTKQMIVAIKRIGCSGWGDAEQTKNEFETETTTLKRVHKEIKIWWDLVHPNITRLLEWQQRHDACFLISDVAEGGDLFDH